MGWEWGWQYINYGAAEFACCGGEWKFMTFRKYSIPNIFFLHADISTTVGYPEKCMGDDTYELYVVASERSKNSLV